jgi:hypothetical protein
MRLLFFVILSFTVYFTFAQGDLYSETRKYNRNEKSFGIVFNSNGFGFNYKIGRRLDGRKKLLFEFDALYVKHPKEIRIKTYDSGNRFVYGKMNFPINLRINVGRQKVIYEKKDRSGVKISYFYNAGISAMTLKPVYYNLISDGRLTEQKFDITEIHTFSQIHSRSTFFRGFNEITIVPGAHLKFGFDFDFAISDDKIHSLAAGFAIDGYLKEIQIMATETNPIALFSLFVVYRFGNTTETRLNKN